MNRFRIGLTHTSTMNWSGGIHYLQNIVRAVSILPADIRDRVELHLICEHHADLAHYESIRDMLQGVHVQADFVPPADPAPDPSPQAPPSAKPARPRGWKRWFKRSSHAQEPSVSLQAPTTAFETHTPAEPLEPFNRFVKSLALDFVYPYPAHLALPETPVYSTASWIPDFQHVHLPAFFSPDEVAARTSHFAVIAQRAKKIVLSSESAFEDFKTLYPEEAHKVQVLRFKTLAVDTWYEPNPADIIRRYHLPEQYLLVCNQFWQHKNHNVVLDALRLLRERDIRPMVVMTGGLSDYRNPTHIDAMLRLIHESGLHEQVRLMGLIPRADQIQLIRGAQAMIQPSLFEGWSTVVEDGRTFGKRLLMSDIAVHREQAPPEGCYFNPHDPAALANLLAECWQNPRYMPDFALEAQARQQNREETRQFGLKFLEIAGVNLPVAVSA